MTVVRFAVLGNPAPQGSKTRMPNGAMVEGRSTAQRIKHTHWRDAVADRAAWAATCAGLVAPLTGPLHLAIVFVGRRPKSWPKKRLGWWDTQPDLDKLLRSTCDALKIGGLIHDDALIVSAAINKIVVADGPTGAQIIVQTIEYSPHPLPSDWWQQ